MKNGETIKIKVEIVESLGVVRIIQEVDQAAKNGNILGLLDYFRAGDYLSRCRAHYLLSHIEDVSIVSHLLEILNTEKDEEFQLRCLDLIAKFADESVAEQLVPLLEHRDPLVIRGTMIALGEIGGRAAAEAMIEFAANPRGRILRREIVGEALGAALQKVEHPEEFLEKIKIKSTKAVHYLRNLKLWQPDDIKRFSIYPASDYFRLQAESRGIDYSMYKKRVQHHT